MSAAQDVNASPMGSSSLPQVAVGVESATPDPTAPPMLDTVSLADMIADTSEPPPAIIEGGVLPRGGLCIVCGPPKVGKSFLVANLGQALAAGRSFGPFIIRDAHRVLLLSAELGYYPLRERLRPMASRFPQFDASNFRSSRELNINLNSSWDMAKIRATLARWRPDVLCIDPLVRFHDGDENSATDMAQVFGRIRALMEDYGLCVILAHHTGKDSARGPRGSSAIMGEYDTAIYVTETDDGLSLHFQMRHAEPPPDTELKFNPDSFWFELASEEAVVSVLRESSAEMSGAEIARECVRRDLCSRSTAYRQMQQALARGAIREVREGVFICAN